MKVEEISSVEIVGGGMRVPQLKLTLAELLKRNVNELNVCFDLYSSRTSMV